MQEERGCGVAENTATDFMCNERAAEEVQEDEGGIEGGKRVFANTGE